MIGKEEREAVLRVMDSKVLSGYQGNWSDNFFGGPEVRALEQEWSQYFKVEYSSVCNSATSGIWAALNAIGLKPGDECVCVPYSMTCSASLPLLFGAKVVFADIEPDYYCMDPEDFEKKITNKTKAVIVVNLFGQPADFDRINKIAKKYGIFVIEDNAQGIGAIYKGRYAGTLADIGIFSLNRHKIINSGEGGVVCTNDKDLDMKVKLSCNHAEAVINDMSRKSIWYPDFYSLVGMNLRMTELCAAIAREQLKKLDSILKVYQDYARYFDIPIRPGCTSAYYKYASMNMPENPNPDLFSIKEHYIRPIFEMPLFHHLGYPQDICPVCREVDKNIKLAWLKNPV